ncbi:methylmalonyl-CoA mutase family protein [Engelhardtia mirabilis]|uniref:Methylmalonyl-CoA mutase small subunit n=1 Tax=Engelhardtia mirabilis TaxID=2528011 RepID=A0A518BKT3_9BACT|nr:Methylmalonyl-CoA mutase small subunit [Planctomycetes bacterium Pla133]QDV01911.1 Methylmalonyl-CoA mutase small subunit [Planctomycetes bacterium Pla86]
MTTNQTDASGALPRADFASPDPSSWRERVERELAGADFDRALRTRLRGGLTLEPLYTSRPDYDLGAPGRAPFVRGVRVLGEGGGSGATAEESVEAERVAPWCVLSRASGADPATEGAALRADLAGGASGLWLEFDAEAAWGLEGADDGVVVRRGADLALLLDGVVLEAVGLELDAGAAFAPAAAALLDVSARAGVADGELNVRFGADPLGVLARDGALPGSLEASFDQLAELVRFSAEYLPGCRAIGVDVSAYHRAGADAPLELGVAVATAAAYLRAMEQRGIDPAVTAREIAFAVEVDRELFPEIAKLRALRWLWAHLIESCGIDPVPAPWIRAATSSRILTRRDPWTNVLRASTTTFAAICGGADAIHAACYDDALGQPSELGRRVARNLHHVLAEESGLGRVADPAGGAYLVEQLTADLAAAGWRRAQELDGRLAEWITGGGAASELKEAWAGLAQDVARRKRPITGVSEFPQHGESLPEPARAADPDVSAVPSSPLELNPQVDLAKLREVVNNGADFARIMRALSGDSEPALAPPLVARREAWAFEALRDAADELGADARPVWIATLGPASEHRARVGWIENLYAVGGIPTVAAPLPTDPAELSAAIAERRPALVCVAGSDERYATELEPALARLRAAGATHTAVAGKPGEREAALRAAGAEHFVHLGMDVVAHLRTALEFSGAKLEEVGA